MPLPLLGGGSILIVVNYKFSFTYEEIFKAYEDCIRHKKNSPNAIKFMLNKNENVIQLCDEINDRTYTIGTSIAFIIKFPKYREVFAADFRDRIIHHLVVNELMPYFKRYFIPESFSCMIGRGTLHGIETMAKYMDECSQHYTIPTYVLKMDVQAFFMSIDKQLLANRLDKFIADVYPDNRKKDCLRWLCNMIIMHHPERNCIIQSSKDMWKLLGKGKSLFDVEEGKGLAIGNLTSQMFANFFMTVLDYYIKNELGFKYYGRYVDDFMLYDTDKDKVKQAIPLIKKYCNEKLLINVHPDKIYLQEITHGVKFIGADIMPNRMYCGNRTIGQFYNKLYTKYRHFNKDRLDNFVSSVNSYLGYMCHYSTYNMRKEIIINSGLFDEWKDYIEISKDLLKIKRKYQENLVV